LASSAVSPAIVSSLRALLLGGGRDAQLALAQRLLTADERAILVGGLAQPAVELIELARQLLLLGDDALLHPLELVLAAPRVLFQRGPHLERGLPRLELAGLAQGVGLALALGDDLLGGDAGVAEPAIGEPLVEENADQEGQQSDQGIEPRQRVHHPSSRTRPFSVIEVRVRFDEYRWRRAASQMRNKSPRLCRVPWCFEPGMTRWASLLESFRLPLRRGACTPLSRSTPVV